MLTNLRNGNAYGFEISSSYTPLDSWKLSGSYSYLQQITHSTAPGSIVFSFPGQDGDNPRNQFQLHSYLTLPQGVETLGSFQGKGFRATLVSILASGGARLTGWK
jgi:outer membrane receptor protein involved in Fe transport